MRSIIWAWSQGERFSGGVVQGGFSCFSGGSKIREKNSLHFSTKRSRAQKGPLPKRPPPFVFFLPRTSGLDHFLARCYHDAPSRDQSEAGALCQPLGPQAESQQKSGAQRPIKVASNIDVSRSPKNTQQIPTWRARLGHGDSPDKRTTISYLLRGGRQYGGPANQK